MRLTCAHGCSPYGDASKATFKVVPRHRENPGGYGVGVFWVGVFGDVLLHVVVSPGVAQRNAVLVCPFNHVDVVPGQSDVAWRVLCENDSVVSAQSEA